MAREDDTSYYVEVQVTKSIRDERVVAKADVLRVRKEDPSVAAYEAISNLVPTPDALDSDEYALRIKAVEKFVKEHRGASDYREAKEMLATLKAEANEVLAGGIKMNGKIIPPAEYRANAYDIDSRIEAAKIKELIDRARFLEALRAFSDYERNFQSTTAYSELLPLVERVIRTYLAGVNQSLTTFDKRTKDREIGLERMAAADRGPTERAIAEENAMLEKRFAAEKQANVGWVTTHPFFKTSLAETMTFGQRELARLALKAGAPEVDGGKSYRDALSLIQSGGDKAAVTAAIAAARTQGVGQEYIDRLEAAAASAATP